MKGLPHHHHWQESSWGAMTREYHHCWRRCCLPQWRTRRELLDARWGDDWRYPPQSDRDPREPPCRSGPGTSEERRSFLPQSLLRLASRRERKKPTQSHRCCLHFDERRPLQGNAFERHCSVSLDPAITSGLRLLILLLVRERGRESDSKTKKRGEKIERWFVVVSVFVVYSTAFNISKRKKKRQEVQIVNEKRKNKGTRLESFFLFFLLLVEAKNACIFFYFQTQ